MRAALVHLALGFTFGALLSARAITLPPDTARLLPAHMEMLLVGWTIQLAMGVGYWILPRLAVAAPAGSRAPRGLYGNQAPAWAAFVLLNAGVLMVGVAPFGALPGALTAWGRAAELAAALAFGLTAWPRVKPPSV